jgi:hypothetical protein
MLKCRDTGLVYYGSSAHKYLSQRLRNHRSDYKKWLEGKSKQYISSFEIMKNNNYEIILVELYPCQSIDELRSRERYYIDNNECVNKRKEWYKENKDNLIAYYQAYRQKNRDELNRKDKIKYIKRRDLHLQKCKEYRHINREKLNQQKKEYYEKNKERLNQRAKEKVECECGSIINHGGLAEHRKSKKHLTFLTNK